MQKMPKRIVIAGGGTAGWMAASLMHHHWGDKGIEICLVESPMIGIIGVGEGSTPSLKYFFETLNISEAEWMPACNATHKVNIEFCGWSPGSGRASYSHPFISQLDTFSEPRFYTNCLTRRLGLDVETQPEKFLLNGWLAKHEKLPLPSDNFPFKIEYGYHFDSGLLGQFLCERGVAAGIKHIQAKISEVVLNQSGDVKGLALDNSTTLLEADFFIDCTGFDSLILQQALGVKFSPFKANLFNDRAVAMPSAALKQSSVQTKSTALSHGWAWQIPLTQRTGNGYVYSSDYYDAEQAETELRAHLGLLDADVSAKHLQMKVGRVEQHWQRNCLAIGLSQGFIEPLEATALHLTQITIESFIDAYQDGDFSDKHQQSFNQDINTRYERVRDYIVAHYKLNTRTDSQYWQDNRDNMNLSESLQQVLHAWYTRNDLAGEIKRQKLEDHFGVTSWHCLLAGYGAFPAIGAKQPGTGDHYHEFELEKFFAGCLLNFPSVG